MKTFAAWFTPDRRQAIQVFAGSLAPLLILLGFGTQNYWDQWLIITGMVLQFASNLLSLLSLKLGEWGKAWAIFRGAIYSLALGVAPALVALEYWSSEFSSTFLLGLSLALGALGNLVSIFSSKQQELDELRRTGTPTDLV